MEKHIFPHHGNTPVAEIKPLDLLATIQNIEERGTTEISHRVLQTCSAVFRYAFVLGKVEYNPATSLQRGILKAHKAKNYPTIAARQIPAFLKALNDVHANPLHKLAIRLLLHTFVRQGELRRAKWEDIDWKAKEWRLPAANTKMRVQHLVPLCRQSIAILKEVKKLTGTNAHGLLFPSQHLQKNPMMCENTINNVLKRMGYKGQLVGHGFRALASTTLHEQGYKPDVIERQLAHKEPNAIRAAYNHAEHLAERRTMMQAWGDYLDKQAMGGMVVNLKEVG
ncbi:MAG: site-specific integrase [Alphaproteobacteria bacterium]